MQGGARQLGPFESLATLQVHVVYLFCPQYMEANHERKHYHNANAVGLCLALDQG